MRLRTLLGNLSTESLKARAQGVTTRVKTVATARPTTKEPAICSQKLVIYEPLFTVLSIKSMLYPKAMGINPAIVVKEVKNTGLSLNTALLKAKDLVSDPGLFFLRRLKVSMSTMLLLTTMPARATQQIPVCRVLKDLSKIKRDTNTPPKDKRIAESTILAW